MDYTDKIKFDLEDHVDKDSYNNLNANDWADWIRDRFHGRDHIIPMYDRDGDVTTYAFTLLLSELEDPAKTTLYNGIVLCLDEAYNERKQKVKNNLSWEDKGLEKLLHIISIRAIESGRKIKHNIFSEEVDRIKRFLQVLEPKPEQEHDLCFKVLATLASINAKLPYEFWLENLKHSPIAYSGVCFNGAKKNSPYDAIRILPHIDWSHEKISFYMEQALLSFFTHQKDSEVITYMNEQKMSLPMNARKFIDENYQRILRLKKNPTFKEYFKK